eukprot:13504155-Alexandrium_andersonii.AAC.1
MRGHAHLARRCVHLAPAKTRQAAITPAQPQTWTQLASQGALAANAISIIRPCSLRPSVWAATHTMSRMA